MMAAFGFSLITLITKFLGTHSHVTQILLLRQIGMIIIVAPAVFSAFPGVLGTNRLNLQVARIFFAKGRRKAIGQDKTPEERRTAMTGFCSCKTGIIVATGRLLFSFDVGARLNVKLAGLFRFLGVFGLSVPDNRR